MTGAERISIGVRALARRLREQGLLASVDASRKMLLVRRILEGRSGKVLHLKAGNLVSLETESHWNWS